MSLKTLSSKIVSGSSRIPDCMTQVRRGETASRDQSVIQHWPVALTLG